MHSHGLSSRLCCCPASGRLGEVMDRRIVPAAAAGACVRNVHGPVGTCAIDHKHNGALCFINQAIQVELVDISIPCMRMMQTSLVAAVEMCYAAMHLPMSCPVAFAPKCFHPGRDASQFWFISFRSLSLTLMQQGAEPSRALIKRGTAPSADMRETELLGARHTQTQHHLLAAVGLGPLCSGSMCC